MQAEKINIKECKLKQFDINESRENHTNVKKYRLNQTNGQKCRLKQTSLNALLYFLSGKLWKIQQQRICSHKC